MSKLSGMSPSGQALDSFLREQFDVLQYLRENMDSILAVANHLTPVEDLEQFKDQIEALHPNLGLLVEASTLILSASDAGIALLQAIDAPAQRAALGLGSAALRGEEFFAEASALQATNVELAALSTFVDQINTALQEKVSNGDLLALTTRVTNLEAEINISTRLDQLLVDLSNGLYYPEDTATLRNRVTVVETTQDTTIQRTEALEMDIIRLDGDMAGSLAVINQLTGRTTTVEGTVTLQGEHLLSVDASLVNLENLSNTQAGALQTLTGQVTEHEDLITSHASALLLLTGRVEDAESAVVAEVGARTELETRVEITETTADLLSQNTTALFASLTSMGNVLPNTAWNSGFRDWEIYSVGAGWEDAELQLNLAPTVGALPSGVNALSVTSANAPVTGLGIRATAVPVDHTQKYMASGYLAAENCTVRLEYRLLGPAGDIVDFGVVGQSTVAPAAMLGDWPRVFSEILLDSGVAKIEIQLWILAVTGTPKIWLVRPQLEPMVPGQVNPSPWVEGVSGLEIATATALETLSTRVTDNENGITAHSLQLVELTTRVTDVETDVVGSADAIQALDTRVTANEGTITAHSQSIVDLQASVNTLPRVFLQPTEPTAGQGPFNVGDMWLNSANGNKASVWDGTIWSEEVDLIGATIYAQDTAPAIGGLRVGDAWFKTSDNNRQHRWDGTQWVDVSDARIAATATALTALTTRVTDTEGDISAIASDVTQLEVDVAGKASTVALDALDTRVDTAEGTISSQGTAITSLDTRLDAAEGDIATKASATALEALDTRVDATEVSTTAHAASLVAIKASLSGGGNLLRNSSFSTDLLGWTTTLNNSPIVATVVRHNGNLGDGNVYVPPGVWSCMVHLPGTPGVGQVVDLSADHEAVEPGKDYFASVYLNNIRCNAQLYFTYYDAAGGYISDVVSTPIAPVMLLQASLANSPRLVAGRSTAPANARKARVVVRLLTKGQANPYLWFYRPMFEEVGAEQTEPSPYSPGGVDVLPSLVATNTRMSSAEARLNDTGAGKAIEVVASDLASITAAINDAGTGLATKASINSLNQVQADLDTAEGTIASHTSSIATHTSQIAGKAEASVVTAIETRVATQEQFGKGINLLTNSTFALDLKGWAPTGNVTGTAVRDGYGFSWQPPGVHGVALSPATGTTIDSDYYYFEQVLPAQQGLRYCASAYLAAHRGKVFSYIYFIDESGNAIAGSHFITANTSVPEAGTNIAVDYTRLPIFGTAPVGTRKIAVSFGWRKSLASPAGDNPIVWILRPMLEVATATQTVPSPWNAGGAEAFGSWSVTMNVNGHATGFGLASDGSTSTFKIVADLFELVPASASGARIAMASSLISIYGSNGNIRVKLGVMP